MALLDEETDSVKSNINRLRVVSLRRRRSPGGSGGGSSTTVTEPDIFYNNLFTDQAIIYWSPGGDSYDVNIATDSGFASIVGTYTGALTSQTFTGLSADTQYYVRVRATKSGVTSAYNTVNFFTMPTVTAAYDFSGLGRIATNRYGVTSGALVDIISLSSIINTSGPTLTSSVSNPIATSAGDNIFAHMNNGSAVQNASSPIDLGTGAFTIIFKTKFTSNPVTYQAIRDAVTGGNRFIRIDGLSTIYVAINNSFSAAMTFPVATSLNQWTTFVIDCDGTTVRASNDGGVTWTNSVTRPGAGAAWQLTQVNVGLWEHLLFANYKLTDAQRNRYLNRHKYTALPTTAVDFTLPAKNLPSTFIADPVNGYVNSFTGGLLLKGGYGLGKNVFSIGTDNVICLNKHFTAPDYANTFLAFHNTTTGKVRSLVDLGYYTTIEDIHHVPTINALANSLYILQMNNHYDKGVGSALHVRKSWKNWDFLGVLQLPKAKEQARHYFQSETQYPQSATINNGLSAVFTQRFEITLSYPPKLQVAISDDGLQSFYDYFTFVDTATTNNWVYPIVVYNGSRSEAYVIVEHVIAGVSPVRCAGLSILRTTDFVTYQNMAGTWSKNVRTSGAISLSELYTNATLLDARSLTSTLLGHAYITPSGMMYGVVGNGSNTGWLLFYQSVGGSLTTKTITFGGDTVVTGTQTNTLGTFTFPYHRSPIIALYKGGTTFDVVALQVNSGNWQPTLYRTTDNGDTWNKIGVLAGIDSGLQHTELEFSQNYHYNGERGILACSAALSSTTGKLYIRDANNLI